jgi:hypothetical protein
VRVRTGLNWLSMGFSSGLLWARNELCITQNQGLLDQLNDYQMFKKGPALWMWRTAPNLSIVLCFLAVTVRSKVCRECSWRSDVSVIWRTAFGRYSWCFWRPATSPQPTWPWHTRLQESMISTSWTTRELKDLVGCQRVSKNFHYMLNWDVWTQDFTQENRNHHCMRGFF